jgi:hypothetical protein
MPIYEYQGQKFDLKEGLSNAEAKEKILNFLEEQKDEKDKKPNFFVGLASGVASGALKIPEGFASLAAELIDLGADTDTAASVETFFDKLNPFEEIAEQTLTGKIAEGLIQLGVPGVAGYKLGAGLARRAIGAKKTGKYLDEATGKGLRRKDIDQNTLKSDLATKLKIGGGGLLGSTIGEGLAYTDDFGTIGDAIGGPTETDKTEGLEGREEAFRKFTNRFKFAVESGAIGAGLGATISGVTKAVKATPLARQFDRSPLQNVIGKGLNMLTPNSALGKRAFNILKDGDQIATTYALKSQMMSEALATSAEKISKQALKNAGSQKEEIFTKFQKLVNDRLTDFGKFKKSDFVFDQKGNIVQKQLPDAAYALPKEIVKVNSRGKEFRVANPAYKKREALHDFMKNTLKATDDDILEFENSLLANRYLLDLNSITLDNQFLKPLIREARDVLGIKGLSRQEEKIARDVLASATELSDTFTSQLGKYMNREYKIFKKEKNIFKKIFSGDDFKPTQEIIQKSERVFRTAIAQAYKNSDTTRAKATEIVELRASQRQKQPTTGRRDPLLERERKISKQKAIEEQIDRMSKDYYDNVAPQKAADAVEAIITTRGKSLFETPTGPISGFKKFIKDEASLELDEGIFKERTLRNPVIRQLLGEIEDPFYNIANTNSKQAQIMAQLQTHNKLFQDTVTSGEGGAAKSNMFFDSSAEAREAIKNLPEYKDIYVGPDDIVQIKTKNADIVPSVLDGKYTFKPVAEAITSQDQMLADNTLNNLYKWMVLIPKSISQQAKTIYSPFTHVRNVLSATLFTTMNGNILFQNPAQTARYFKRALKDITGNDAESVARRLRNQRLGINGTSPIAGDIDALAKEVGTDIYTGNFNGFMDKLLGRTSKLAEKARRAYLAEDNLWKNYNFEVELDALKNNFSKLGITADNIFDPKNMNAYSKLLGRQVTKNDPIFDRIVDISPDGKFLTIGNQGVRLEGDKLLETFYENMAAQITKHNLPNYEYVGDFIKSLRRLPLGTFVAFPAEIIRTGYNTIQRGLRELQVEGFKQTGMRRLAGVATTAAVVPAGLVEFGKSLADMTDDDMRALRTFVPSWSENGLLMPVSRDEKTGKVKYVDLSYIFPYDTLVRPVNTILNEASKGQQTGESLNKYLLDAGATSFYELSKPFISESIFFEAFADIVARNGRSRDGRQVFRPGDSVGEKVYKGGMHVLETFMPGSVNQINRLFQAGALGNEKIPDKYGNTYNLLDEAGGIFGFRAIEADPIDAMPFIVTDFNKKNDSARASFVGDVLKGGFVSPAEIVEQYIKSERIRFQNFKQMHNAYKDALQLGANRGKLNKELGRMTKAERQAVISGRYLPYVPGDGVRQAFNENFRELRKELGRDVQNPFILAYPEIMKVRRNNRNIDVNSGDFDSTFVVPEGFNIKEIVPEAPPTTTGPVTTSGGPGTTVTGTQTLESQFAADTLFPNDSLFQELFRQRNT